MRRLGLLLALGMATAWCAPARAQFLDQDRTEIAKKLDETWLSDLPVDGTVQAEGLGICVQDGNLYARDRLIDKTDLIKRVEITMQPNKRIALKFLQTEALEVFLRSIPYLSMCTGSPQGAFAQTLFLVASVDGQTKLSGLWEQMHKH
ncbi:MAG TPA: hypothetical protein VGG99_18895 [Acetobacteraceae bacterium]|jgi:hypothetical protein